MAPRRHTRSASPSPAAWPLLAALGLACGGNEPAAGHDDGSEGGSSGADGSGGSSDGDGISGADGSDSGGTTDARPDWVHDVAPLVFEHCVPCHADGGIAPFSLQDYDSAATWSGSIAAQVQIGLMPPWHALTTDECAPPLPFAHDARLGEAQIQLLADWNSGGAPQGDPADAVPLPEPPSLDLADPSATVAMGGSVTVAPQGGVRDFFHCLSFDPGNSEDVFVDGLQVLPGNRAIVHHVLIYVDEGAESAAWPDGVSHDCGGGAGVGAATLVGGWVPGSMPIELPDGVGLTLPAGARIVFNMHYHAGDDSEQVDDATALSMRWSSTMPQYVGRFELIGAPGAGELDDPPFSIPADATDHVESLQYVVPELGVPEVRVFSVANHMHKVGVDMRTSLTRGSDDTCLLQTPRWDFNWQRLYGYDADIGAMPEVLPGDVVHVRCTYDNSLGNPAVVDALAEQGLDTPQTVALGEGSLDEMCLAGIGVAVRVF
ncbi:MAG: hypothetical protein K1X88_08405 [Nannocystaceae bacterium]|nr:hypothetical protein [Nannocystaceae bacterium]